MAEIQKQFVQFNEKIRLRRYKENDTLREKRDIILSKLSIGLKRVFGDKDKLTLKYEKFDQGSYKLGTGIKPLDGDYDIDVGLRFDLGTKDEPDVANR